MNDLSQPPMRVAAVTGTSRGLGAVFARVEEIVLRSASQIPEY
ncbi:MAG TPA: hypothetical protein VF179_30910 [Thermoanaerobaculia bacterium]|nr:hypothetical protein [Thermoanaerobaculia bacterium]